MLKLGLEREVSVGEVWDEKSSSQVVEILISHQHGTINSIQFTYSTGDKVLQSQTYGKPNGSNFNMVVFDYPVEVLTSLSCEYIYNGELVSITFGTNKNKYGPFGSNGSSGSKSRGYGSPNENCNYEFKPGRFGGFHGIVYNGYVYALGIYIKPYEASPRLFVPDPPLPYM